MVRIQPIMGHEKGFMEHSIQFDKPVLRNMYMDLLKMKEEAEACLLRKDNLPSYAEEQLAEERAKREEAEREKELLEQKCKELQQKLDNQERVLKQLQAEMEEKMRNELRERDEKIQKLEAQMKTLLEEKENTKNDCTSKKKKNKDKENPSKPSLWFLILEAINRFLILITKYLCSE